MHVEDFDAPSRDRVIEFVRISPQWHQTHSGSLGNFEGNVPSFDGGCVDNPFRWCDNLSNNDPNVLTFMSKAFATQVVQMAFDTKVMSASNNSVIKTKLQPQLPRGKVAA